MTSLQEETNALKLRLSRVAGPNGSGAHVSMDELRDMKTCLEHIEGQYNRLPQTDDAAMAIGAAITSIKFMMQEVRVRAERERKNELLRDTCILSDKTEIEHLARLKQIREILDTETERTRMSIESVQQGTEALDRVSTRNEGLAGLLETGKNRIKAYYSALTHDERMILAAAAGFFAVAIALLLYKLRIHKLVRLLAHHSKRPAE